MPNFKLFTGTPVPQPAGALLSRLAGGWTPGSIEFHRITEFSLGDVDLSAAALALTIEDDELQIALSEVAFKEMEALSRAVETNGFRGVLSDGIRFEAEMSTTLTRASFVSDSSPSVRGGTIRGCVWSVVSTTAPPLWAARIEGQLKRSGSGNLAIEYVQGQSSLHYRFKGAYTYYLVHAEVSKGSLQWHIVVDTSNGEALDPRAFRRDMMAMEFVLGRQLRAPLLLGLDSAMATIACVEGYTRRDHLERRDRSPVPTDKYVGGYIDECWAALFFEKLSHAWRTCADRRFDVSVEMYLDAMANHLDSDYARLQVALEAFAWHLIHEKGEDEIIVDKKKWKEWVKANEQAIRTHAKPGFENSLYNKVLSVYRLASGKVVPNAFNSLCLPLTEEMTAELAGRDLVVHRGLMAPDGYDVDRDLRRVAIVRTMLVALVALVCGYRGAILGWEHDYFGTAFAPEDWWKIDPEERERAQQKYLTSHNEDDEVPRATEVPGSPESEPAS